MKPLEWSTRVFFPLFLTFFYYDGSMTQAKSMANIGKISGTVSNYGIKTPDIGSCRLKGIDKNSMNFKNYASVSGKDIGTGDGCGRCVKVTCNDNSNCQTGSSVVAYVLDVCAGCPSGSVKLSQAAFGSDGIGVKENANDVSVSYKFVNCPSTFLSGNIKACFMEGASASYIPLQFYNSQRVITKATINGQEATPNSNSFYFSATPQVNGNASPDWYKNIQVTLSAGEDDTKSGSFSFKDSKGCAESTMQFAMSSTADGADGDNDFGTSKKGGISVGAIVGAVVGALALVAVIVLSMMFVKRKRSSRRDSQDLEEQYLSPKCKAAAPLSVPPTSASTNDNDDPPEASCVPESTSPRYDYNRVSTPASQPSQLAVPSTTQTAPTTVLAVSDSSRSTIDNPTLSYTESTFSFCSNLSGGRSSQPNTGVPSRPYNSETLRESVHSDVSQGECRTSFDIDDMREESSSMSRLPQFDDHDGYDPAPMPVTSPQSYARATSLQRDSYASTGRFSNASSYDHLSTPVRTSAYMPQGVQFPRSSSSFNDTGSSYTRESLNILDYPYARRNGRNGSVTETEF